VQKWGYDGGGSLISPDGVVPSQIVGVSASDICPLNHKVHKTIFLVALAQRGSPGKRAVKKLCVYVFTQYNLCYPVPPVKNWRILLMQSFTDSMPLLMATTTFALDEVAIRHLSSMVLPAPSPYLPSSAAIKSKCNAITKTCCYGSTIFAVG